MKSLSINLLPVDSVDQAKEKKRFKSVQVVSGGTLLVILMVSSVIFALRIFQLQNIKNLDNQAQAEQSQIANFQSKENNLVEHSGSQQVSIKMSL